MDRYHLRITKPGYGEIVVTGNDHNLALFRQIREALRADTIALPPWDVTIERETMEKLP